MKTEIIRGSICIILILVLIIISPVGMNAFNIKDRDLHAIKREQLDVIGNNLCPQYNMTHLKGAYLKDGYGWERNPICIKEKTDGSIDYYYLNEANVPMPYNK